MFIEKGKINARQFSVLVIMFTLGGSVLTKSGTAAYFAKQDAWLVACLSLLCGILLLLLYHKLTARFPTQTLVQYSQAVLGKWLGGVISFLYFCFFLLLTALTLRNLGEFINTEVLPGTPIHVIHIFFLLAVITGIRSGIEVFTRTAELFIPWAIFFFLILVVLLPPDFQIGRMLPILGYGLQPILRATMPFLASPYMELVIFLMLFPFINHAEKARKAWLVGLLIAGIMLIVVSLLTILVLGANLTGRLHYPTYNLAEKISIGHFVERLEILMAGVWFVTIYFKLAICFYATTMTFAELFKLKEAKSLYLPFGMIIIVLSILIFPNITYIIDFISKIYFFYTIPYAILFPLLILIVAMIRKKKAN